jgi:hypothetical protein
MPHNLDTLIGRTCLRGTQTRRPRCREHPDSGANKTAGMRIEVGNDQGRVPRARVPVGMCTIRREPPGPPARLWQTFLREVSAAAGPCARSIFGRNPEDRRRLARGTHASGQNAERGAGRSHIQILRQVASGAASETSITTPGGRDPDRRRCLGFLTASDLPTRRGATRRRRGPISPLAGEKAKSRN